MRMRQIVVQFCQRHSYFWPLPSPLEVFAFPNMIGEFKLLEYVQNISGCDHIFVLDATALCFKICTSMPCATFSDMRR